MAGDDGWIKLYRKLLDSFVNSDAGMMHLWINLMLRANWKPSWFMKRKIGVGQVAFAVANMASILKISDSTLRRRLKDLESAGQITIEATNKFTIVTICNWPSYQHDNELARRSIDEPTDQATDDLVANGRRSIDIHPKKLRSKEGEESKKFAPPSIEQIREYCLERKSNVDPEHFHDHYTSNGWLIGGKSKMKDWRATVRNWERNSRNGNSNGMVPPRIMTAAEMMGTQS